MAFTRRRVLQGGAAIALAAGFGNAAGFSAAQAASPILRAGEGLARLAPGDYPETRVWSYGDRVPGPVIRVGQGERLTRRFVNDLPQPSTVHWHGVRIDNAMDGVPGVTQEAVPVGGTFDYDFTLPDAGTYWYHPHNRTWEQLARGLYGPLIVEEADPPDVDRDEVLILDDWRLTEDAQIHEDSFGAMHDWSHAGRIGNWITVNGKGESRLPAKRFERFRLRLINAANARIFYLSLEGMKAWTVALDGQPLDAPQPVERLSLGPAQRADLIVDITAGEGEEAFLTSHEQTRDGEERFAITGFPVTGVARDQSLADPQPLPANPVPALGDLSSARREGLQMEGGAMGRMQGAMMGGGFMAMRDLAGAGKVWALNGRADMPDTPWITLTRGETVRIAMKNDTAWPHAMHLHGHHFRQMVGADIGPLRDTLLVGQGESAEIAFVADNPGDWLFHCHMVEHSAGGMMTWLRVDA
ncbi:multicopper oxidase family protein [Hwanghaeella grinnelliae]|uniref:multicopper oxidase family protein n=1 Tax=Hwanghaeella grinnelliae TaxID=2500179 RepID=UPI001961A8CC|nr:multicopper oxidase family protein [Hwanghaeella grinnelliae]